jgi:hypothetical protein
VRNARSIHKVSDITALYRQLDPLQPLGADDHGIYVDWQRELDPEAVDVKSRLVRAFVRNATPEHPIVRLMTGHKGSGKTTELNRVSSQLNGGVDGKKVFVSTLFAQRWLDIEDVQPEDLVLQIVRQLVADLRDAGIDLGERRFTSFFRSVWERVQKARLETAEVGIDPLKFSFALKDFPTARDDFRGILRGQLPTVFDLVNNDLLPVARERLKEAHGYDDVLLIVDDLDKIPQKVLGDQGLTNHENLFLDNAATLRAINCSLLLTIPIELAYSPAQGRLRDDYGAAIVTVPLISIVDRDGKPIPQGEDALIEILGRRARRAFGDEGGDAALAAGQVFADRELLLRVIRLLGGHVRGLLVMLTELLDWVENLPLGQETVDRYVTRAAKDLARGLFASDKEILGQVLRTRGPAEDPRFFDLLRNHYVFAYEAGADEYWYGLNPLMGEVEL